MQLHRQELKVLEQFITGLNMTPEKFLEFHPGTSREVLARIADCSIVTVNHWLTAGKSRISPSKYHCLRLAIAHWYLAQKAAQPAIFHELDEIYQDNQEN